MPPSLSINPFHGHFSPPLSNFHTFLKKKTPLLKFFPSP